MALGNTDSNQSGLAWLKLWAIKRHDNNRLLFQQTMFVPLKLCYTVVISHSQKVVDCYGEDRETENQVTRSQRYI